MKPRMIAHLFSLLYSLCCLFHECVLVCSSHRNIYKLLGSCSQDFSAFLLRLICHIFSVALTKQNTDVQKQANPPSGLQTMGLYDHLSPQRSQLPPVSPLTETGPS